VDFSQAGFRPLKATAIGEMGMGSNAKLNLQFTRRLWQEQGCNADTYSETGYRWTRGWRVGQYTQFAGIEREREGNCHFAGSTPRSIFRGFSTVQGKVETGLPLRSSPT
jgi:monoamine oxidase